MHSGLKLIVLSIAISFVSALPLAEKRETLATTAEPFVAQAGQPTNFVSPYSSTASPYTGGYTIPVSSSYAANSWVPDQKTYLPYANTYNSNPYSNRYYLYYYPGASSYDLAYYVNNRNNQNNMFANHNNYNKNEFVQKANANKNQGMYKRGPHSSEHDWKHGHLETEAISYAPSFYPPPPRPPKAPYYRPKYYPHPVKQHQPQSYGYSNYQNQDNQNFKNNNKYNADKATNQNNNIDNQLYYVVNYAHAPGATETTGYTYNNPVYYGTAGYNPRY